MVRYRNSDRRSLRRSDHRGHRDRRHRYSGSDPMVRPSIRAVAAAAVESPRLVVGVGNRTGLWLPDMGFKPIHRLIVCTASCSPAAMHPNAEAMFGLAWVGVARVAARPMASE
jgi:hypothetical protein